MNLPQVAVNRSFNSNENSLSRNQPNQAPLAFNQSYSKEGLPENGGMLKPSMRFEYEFSSPKKKQPSPSFRSELPAKDVSLFRLNAVDHNNREGRTMNANLFSCMDGTQYEREFEVSPSLIDKQ